MRQAISFLTIFFALSCLPAAPATARAPEFSGSELLSLCSSKYDTDYGYCAGFVGAVSNLLLSEPVGGFRACGHKPVRSQQQIDLFRSYAEIFPEKMKQDASVAVAGAMARAFPCP